MSRPTTTRRVAIGLLIVGSLAGLACLGMLVACALSRPGPRPAAFDGGGNAAWLGVEWVSEPHSPDEIRALARDLDSRDIRLVFVFASYLKPGLGFTQQSQYASAFLHELAESAPGIEAQAWIGLPLTAHDGGDATSGHADLGDPATRARIVAFSCDLLRQTGFRGVHLDPEPVQSEHPGLLLLLDELRSALDPGAHISIAASKLQLPLPDKRLPLLGDHSWRASYMREVARRLDAIAVMTYDSGLPVPCLYELWLREQTVEISRALEGIDATVYLGVPVSRERTWSHHPWSESMGHAVRGIRAGLADRRARPSAVTGLAVYPFWEAAPSDWTVYESEWLNWDAQKQD